MPISYTLPSFRLYNRPDHNWDWLTPDFDIDSWEILDCSLIVPVGTKFIWFRGLIHDSTVGGDSSFFLAHPIEDENFGMNQLGVRLQNEYNCMELHGFVACDSLRRVKYYADEGIDGIQLVIRGYMK